MSLLALLMLLMPSDLFTADARASTTYEVTIPREKLKLFVDDIGLFARNMPGVVSVAPVGGNRYLYKTEKSIPLAGTMQTEFLIERQIGGDSLTVYRSIDDAAENFMDCRVLIRPVDAARTSITIGLRVRLSRSHASDIHWLAPILGESFIRRQMEEDLKDMLVEFIERSNRELYARLEEQLAADR